VLLIRITRMKIKNVQISNYRSCIQTKFDLHDNLTALIGINGVGKSNILNALQLLKKGRKVRRFYGEENFENLSVTNLNFTIEIENRIILIRSKIYYETDERNTDDIYSIEMKLRDEDSPGKWINIENYFFEVVDYMNRTGTSIIPKKKEFQSEEARFIIQLLNSLNKVNYYSATQFSDPSKCPISFELEDENLIRSYRNNHVHDSFMYELYRTFKSKPDIFNLFLNTVGSQGMQIIEDFSFIEHEIPSSSYKVRAGGQIVKIEKIRKIVVPSVVIDELNLSPNQLSEGTFKTLALVFYIINDHSQLLLIEEPEVCVHHGLLNSIIELIQICSKDKQIIISTHSDYVLDKLNPDNILLIKKDRGTEAKNLTKSLTKNEYKVLKEYLEKTGNLGEYWKEGGFDNE